MWETCILGVDQKKMVNREITVDGSDGLVINFFFFGKGEEDNSKISHKNNLIIMLLLKK